MPISNAIRGTLILLNPNAKANKPYLDSTLFNFQFNPESLNHAFTSEQVGAGASSNVPQGLMVEFFNLTFDLESDGIDPQEKTPTTTSYGLHPVLAVLESMAQPYPTANNQTQLPAIILKWGDTRAIPTKVVGINIEETAFDNLLNPTKATVNLSMRVIQKAELKTDSPAYKTCDDHMKLRNKLVGLYKGEHPQLEQSVGGVGIAGASAATAASGSALGAGAGKSKRKAKTPRQ